MTGKFKGMLFCATNQYSNGAIFILAHGYWLYILRHFQNAGLANSITFFMSDRDKGLINAVRKVFPDMDCKFTHYVIPKGILDIRRKKSFCVISGVLSYFSTL